MKYHDIERIFEQSACLTRRQIKGYVNGSLTAEEDHAVERHLNSCPLCSGAIDGLLQSKDGLSVGAITTLSSSFLKEHFGAQQPKVHLNSMAHALALPRRRNRFKGKTQAFRISPSFGMFMLIGAIVFWYVEFGKYAFARSKHAVQNATMHTSVAGANNPENIFESNTAPQLQGFENDAIPVEPMPVMQASAVAAPAVNTVPPAMQKPVTSVAQTSTQSRLPEPERQAIVTQKKESESEEREEIAAKPEHKTETNSVEKTNEPVVIDKKHNAPDEDNGNLNAIAAYKKDMNSSDKKKRQQAALKLAGTYQQMGETSSARDVLKEVASGRGKEKREAKRRLRQMQDQAPQVAQQPTEQSEQKKDENTESSPQ